MPSTAGVQVASYLDLVILVVVFYLCHGLAGHSLLQTLPVTATGLHITIQLQQVRAG